MGSSGSRKSSIGTRWSGKSRRSRCAVWTPNPASTPSGLHGAACGSFRAWSSRLKWTSRFSLNASCRPASPAWTNCLAEGVQRGEPGVLAMFEETPVKYLEQAKGFGLDLQQMADEHKLKLIYLRPLDLSVVAVP